MLMLRSNMVENIKEVLEESMMIHTRPTMTNSMATSGPKLSLPTNGKRMALTKLKNLTHGEELVMAGSDHPSTFFMFI